MEDQYPGRGYCDESEDYILPKVHDNFITDDEREYILEKAESEFEDSIILGGTDKNIRKSKTAWISRNDPVIKPIIKRVCDLTGIPHENAEKLQVVKYQPDGYYKEHHDAACDPGKQSYEFEQNGGQRKVTMLIYLSDEFEGGATRFPNLDMELKPDMNSGILFYPLQKNGDKCHPHALHAGLPVETGEKYIANVWLRESAFNTD
jgi:prolyl 4-hydroxylase